jgi:hypothetical protein
MLGLPVFLRTERIPSRAFTQILREVLQMAVQDFQSLTADNMDGPGHSDQRNCFLFPDGNGRVLGEW